MEQYKKAIIELMEKIHNENALQRIYNLALYIYTREKEEG